MTLIYGRRRVGKSELIKQALTQSDARAIYYECKETSEEIKVESLAALIPETYGLPPLAFPSMEKLLEFLFTRSGESKLILVLDEYPYLRTAIKGFDSVVQTLIDRFADTSHLSLVFCGSAHKRGVRYCDARSEGSCSRCYRVCALLACICCATRSVKACQPQVPNTMK